MKREVCALTNKPFDCQECDLVDKSGKCPYMKLDDWCENTLHTMRKKIEKEGNEKSRS